MFRLLTLLFVQTIAILAKFIFIGDNEKPWQQWPVLFEQAGTDPSRRHIWGSKIAKWLQSVKVFSFTVPKKPKKRWTELARLKGTLSHFLTSIVAKHQKIEEGTLWWKKSNNTEKSETDPLVSTGIVCYAEKEEKPLFGSDRINDPIWDHKIS